MGLFDFCSKLYIDDFYHIVLKDFPNPFNVSL